jgi:hypothetical protein
MNASAVLRNNNASSVGSAGAESLGPLPVRVDPFTAANAKEAANQLRPQMNALTAARLASAAPSLTAKGMLANARRAANMAVLEATTLRELGNSTEAQRKAARNAAKKAIKEYADMNVSGIIPINFKGDGLGRTAGYGYKFNKGKTFGNFAHGFPFKYYRVYGNSTNNVTQKVKDVQKMLKNIQNAKEAVDEATILAKQKAREEQKALREHQALLNQQQKNLFLAERELARAGRGAVLSAAMTPERLAKLQEVAVLQMKERISGVLQGVIAPENEYEALLADRYKTFKSFNRLPEQHREKLLKLTRNSIKSKARLGLMTTAGRKAGRAYNVASYYTRGRPAASREFENVFLQGNATGPAPLSRSYTARTAKPSANAGAPRRGFFTGVRNFFTRKNPSAAAVANGSA